MGEFWIGGELAEMEVVEWLLEGSRQDRDEVLILCEV